MFSGPELVQAEFHYTQLLGILVFMVDPADSLFTY